MELNCCSAKVMYITAYMPSYGLIACLVKHIILSIIVRYLRLGSDPRIGIVLVLSTLEMT
jgi:hypothetical protein